MRFEERSLWPSSSELPTTALTSVACVLSAEQPDVRTVTTTAPAVPAARTEPMIAPLFGR